MRFWFSGEINVDVVDAHRDARKDVEVALTEALGSESFGQGLEKWAFIAIILEYDHPDYPEILKYHKRDKSVEARSKVPHDAFKSATDTVRRTLIVEALLRGVRAATKIVPAGVELGRLEEGILNVARRHSWIG